MPFEIYQPGMYLHGTKADVSVGEMLVTGRESNFEEGRVMNYVYFTATLDAATPNDHHEDVKTILRAPVVAASSESS